MKFAATLFFDVGGVLLTNGWDTEAREAAIAQFGLNGLDFHTRHAMLRSAFETGRLSLDQYLQKAVFFRPQTFKPDEFKAFMFEQSQLLPDGALELARALASTGRYRLCTLNNESRELNEYRIERFALHDVFVDFFTSCYLGMEKPDEDIYRAVQGITRCPTEQAIFIDDRSVNVETAIAAGYCGIQFHNVDQLRKELADRGINLN